ncbi:folate-binding protein YgfZ [Frankia sp. CiP3]|uniref:CAF17-like 4Fe-4S cluster assembly/insertion protein YgfZ n=1 Tax=Frankia sp. CiP3 TaxID=2880971 RepID=UPI001EF7199F|nr:folate-binding protein [Frankia sp. CiP3]
MATEPSMATDPTGAPVTGAESEASNKFDNDIHYRSPLLDITGAVPATGPDLGVADHYGDPLREQRKAASGAVVVDRSHRGVVGITGPDRLSWLHSITSQHLGTLPAMRGSEALVLSPHGHVEHHLMIADDGTTTWLDVEPGTTDQLLAYLASMRFLLRVEPVDSTGDRAVLSVIGPAAVAAVTDALGPLDRSLPCPDDRPATRAGPTEYDGDRLAQGPYPLAATHHRDPGISGGTLVRAMPHGVDLLIPRPELTATVDRLRSAGVTPAGIAAFEALRVAGRRPRLGVDTDHRTIPHEVGWLSTAVHLDKGCYRGQETVARVHNLGRPPRRMVLLHLDGTTVAQGAQVSAAGRTVGFVGTSATHGELGPIALAILKRGVADDTILVVNDPAAGRVAASIDPASGPQQPARPAGRLTG